MARDLKLSVLLQAVDRVTGPLRGITEGSSKTAKALRASRDQLKELERTQQAVKGFAELKRQSQQTSIALAAEQQRVRELSREIAAGAGDSKALTRERAKAIKHAAKLKQQYQNEQQQLQKMRGRLSDTAGVTGSLSERQRQLAQRIADTNRRIQQQQERLKRVKTLQERMAKAREAGGALKERAGALLRGAAVAGGLLMAGFAATGGSFASDAEDARQWAARLGMTTEALTRYTYAASQFGIQNDAMIDGLKELSLRADEYAVTGAGGAAESFQRLGLSRREIDDLSGNTEALFETVLEQLRQVENVAARQRLVDELFGGTGGEQMAEFVSATADAMRRLHADADALNITLSEQDAETAREYMLAWRAAQGAMVGLRDTMGRELAPVMTGLLREFTSWVRDNNGQVREFAKELGAGLRAAVPIVIDLARGLGALIGNVATVVSYLGRLVGGMDNLALIVAGIFAAKTVLAAVAFIKALWGLGAATAALAGGLPAVAAGIKAIGLALAANPIGLVIMAIAGAAYLIYKNWGSIGPWFASLWDGIKAAIATGWEWIKSLFAWSPLGLVLKSWGPIVDFFSGLWDKLQAVRDWLFGTGDRAGSVQKAAGAAALGASVAAGPAIADVPIDHRPPVATAARAAGDVHIGPVHITIHAAPGMDPNAIGRAVAAEIRKLELAGAARVRSSLRDLE